MGHHLTGGYILFLGPDGNERNRLTQAHQDPTRTAAPITLLA